MLMGSTHPQPRGRLQNRALCVQHISSRGPCLAPGLCPTPGASAGLLAPRTVEASSPAHSFPVTEVTWAVDRKVAPSYEKKGLYLALKFLRARERSFEHLQNKILKCLFFSSFLSFFFPIKTIFFLAQQTGTEQFYMCTGTWVSCPF